MALVHIFAGLLAITAGAVALFAAKGGRLHRRSGMVFVFSMLAMSSAGAAIAATMLHIPFQRLNVIAGAITFYFVITAYLTVQPRSRNSRWMDVFTMGVGFAVSILSLKIGFDAMNAPKAQWFPAVPAFVFGVIAFASALGDLHMIRRGGRQGRHRLVRHLWRMCFALFIATGSFFLGQMKIFPEPIRLFPLLAIPAFLPLAMLLFWLVRVRFLNRLPAA